MRPAVHARSQTARAAQLNEGVDHCVGGFMGIVEGPIIGEDRDVELIDVAPNSDIHATPWS